MTFRFCFVIVFFLNYVSKGGILYLKGSNVNARSAHLRGACVLDIKKITYWLHGLLVSFFSFSWKNTCMHSSLCICLYFRRDASIHKRQARVLYLLSAELLPLPTIIARA